MRYTFLMFVMFFGMVLGMNGQQIVVQVINGKTNKPISKARIFVSFPSETRRQSVQLNTDRNGEASFPSDGIDHFEIHPIALVTCGEQPAGTSQPSFSTAEVLSSGILTKNNCGQSGREPIRGKIVYFVRTAGWLELFKN
jgi:hypothetical protein